MAHLPFLNLHPKSVTKSGKFLTLSAKGENGDFWGETDGGLLHSKAVAGSRNTDREKDIGLKRFASIAQKTTDLSRWENYPDVSFIVRQFIIHTNPD
jgi:hypothetical protein